jgi:hypothetical protein
VEFADLVYACAVIPECRRYRVDHAAGMPVRRVERSTACLGFSMRLDIATHLPCKPSVVIDHVNSPALLVHIAKPLVTFVAIEPPQFPVTWAEGTYWVSMRLFDLIPLGKQAIVISHPPGDIFTLRDNGHSALIKTWDHLITITPSGSGTLYRDQVTIDAGLLTPLVWLFALFFYRHRQRRWRQLARAGFNYGDH